MSRCVECDASGECWDWCGKSQEDLCNEIEEQQEKITKLEIENLEHRNKFYSSSRYVQLEKSVMVLHDAGKKLEYACRPFCSVKEYHAHTLEMKRTNMAEALKQPDVIKAMELIK